MSMKDAVLSADLDDLQARLHCAIELVRVVHTALADSVSVPVAADFDGLYAAYCLLESLDREFAEKIDAVCKQKIEAWARRECASS